MPRIIYASIQPPSSSLVEMKRYLSSFCGSWQNRIWVLVRQLEENTGRLVLPEIRRIEREAGNLHSAVWELIR